ncbi:MAG: glycosyltransferase family 39 protein, partial [Vampirovibrionales bacterium]|nr:glycosyltransferase family 39 protein [Vampirovibrionales bacterium]
MPLTLFQDGSRYALKYWPDCFWILFTLSALGILFFYGLGSYPLFDVDEPRYAEAARVMVASGDWVTPYFNQALRFDKPVFHYWLIAGCYKLLGVNEFAARLPSALAGAGSCLLMGLWTLCSAQKSNLQKSALVTLVSACTLEVIGLGHMSITDMTLAFYLLATWVSLYFVAQKNSRFWLLAGVFSGCATLTKGPVGIVLPGLLFVIEQLWCGRCQGNWAQSLKKIFYTPWFLAGLLAWSLVCLPWYWMAYQANGQAFLDALVLHNVTRYADVVSGHRQIPGFYLWVLLVGFFPWTPFLPVVTIWLRQQFSASNGVLPIVRSALVWSVGVFLFYAVAKTKLLTYILPVFPTLGLLLTFTLLDKQSWQDRSSRRLIKGGSLLLSSVIMVVGLIFLLTPSTLLPREASLLQASPDFWLPVSLLAIGSLWTTGWLFRGNAQMAMLSQCSFLVVAVAVGIHCIVPKISHATQGQLHYFVSLV